MALTRTIWALAIGLLLCAAPVAAQDLRERAMYEPEAALLFAQRYDAGRGVPLDRDEALRWYRHAANLGSEVGAMNAAALLDQAGRRGEAAEWYARASLGGNARAAFALGQLYAAGDGVPENAALARAWFDRAANKIPRAAARRDALPRSFGTIDPDPVPVAGVMEGERATMTWTAGEDPQGRLFRVTVFDSAGYPVAEADTALSAVALDAPNAVEWTVARVDGVARAAPLLPTGTAPGVGVLIRVAEGNAAASRLADALETALSTTAAVRREPAAPFDDTAVAFAWPGASALAGDIAAFLPGTVETRKTEAIRTDIVVTLADGMDGS